MVEYEARSASSRAGLCRKNLPGFERAQLSGHRPHAGVRQTRLLRGEYVLTKNDVLERRWFADWIGQGRDYYYPYRVMLPASVDNLLVAGRCFSATSEAQKMSREIPPMFVLGQAAGVPPRWPSNRTAAAATGCDRNPGRLRRQGVLLGADRDPASAIATERIGCRCEH